MAGTFPLYQLASETSQWPEGDGPSRLPRKRIGGLSDWQKRKVAKYIEENLDRCIRVEELGRHVRLGTSRFSKGFRVSFGKSPYDYVLARRIETAKQLLAFTDEPLSQVAQACGLSDQSHFSKVFKRLVGMAPLKWRRDASGSAPCDR